MAALMAAATIWESTVLTMSIFATIWLHTLYEHANGGTNVPESCRHYCRH